MFSLYITAALIGSGKSTWAKKQNAYIVDPDDLRSMINGGEYHFTPQIEPLLFNVSYQLLEGLLHHRDVIFDDIGHSVARRSPLIQRFKGICKIIAVHFPPDGKNLDRRLKSPRGLSAKQWENAYDEMMKEYSPPSIEEGFDEVITVNLSL